MKLKKVMKSRNARFGDVIISYHCEDRLKERNVTKNDAIEALKKGKLIRRGKVHSDEDVKRCCFYYHENDTTAVVDVNDNFLLTAFKGMPRGT